MKAHATAVIDPRAEIAGDVEIGAYAVIGAGVRIGEGCRIAAHAIVMGPLAMGARNEVHSFAALGGPAQDKRAGGASTRVDIGDENIFREHVTIHRGTRDSATSIGSKNLFMVQCHVAHDVTIGSSCVIANAVQLAGHVVVEDHATFGGLAGVAQFVRIGESAFVAAGAMVERDVPPFCIAAGDRARVRAINRVGIERRQLPAESVAEIERVFRAVLHGGSTRAVALEKITTHDAHAQKLIDALKPR